MIIKTRRKRNSLTDWFMMTQEEVENRFLELPNAVKVGEGEKSFVFIPGTRDDRVLLVAHSDTVWDDFLPIVPVKDGKIWANCVPKVGLGADDRAGCAILWKLRNLGHSLLIPNAEESGCVGSEFLMRQEKWRDIISQHSFALQFDREGSSDLVYYDVGSTEFVDWLPKQMKGYKNDCGSFTDITVLCQDICGANISVGYYHQHTAAEFLDEREWNRTLSTVSNLLQKKKIPRFELTLENRVRSRFSNFNYPSFLEEIDEYPFKKSSEDYVVCDKCDCFQCQAEIDNNHGLCIFCNQPQYLGTLH